MKKMFLRALVVAFFMTSVLLASSAFAQTVRIAFGANIKSQVSVSR